METIPKEWGNKVQYINTRERGNEWTIGMCNFIDKNYDYNEESEQFLEDCI